MTWREASARRSAPASGAVGRPRRPWTHGLWKIFKLVIGYLVMIGMAVLCLVPFVWMVSTSLKSMSAVYQYPPRLIPDEILWSNYADIYHALPFLLFVRNSLYISVTVSLGQLLTCSMAAYAFARMRFKWRDTLFLLWLGTMMIPSQVTLVASYVLMCKIGWIDSHKALIIPGVLGGVYGTFLIRQSFLSIPQELEDAAVMDGASPLWVYRAVMIPLSKPVLATYGLFTFMWTWNDFLWPLMMINSTRNMTLTVGINVMARNLYVTKWPHLMAGTTTSVVPILLLLVLLQRYFVQGITLTGMKV